MKSIYLILGNSGTRKSSLVRCLIGTDNPATQVEVRLITGMEFRIRGLIGAAQERGLLPGDWVSDLEHDHWHGAFPSVRNIIATLLYDAETLRGVSCPPGEEYVDALINAGWCVKGIVSLGEDTRSWVRHSGLPYIAIPNAPTIPSNAIAATVRTAFGWA
jgi:hypothetical protein